MGHILKKQIQGILNRDILVCMLNHQCNRCSKSVTNTNVFLGVFHRELVSAPEVNIIRSSSEIKGYRKL